MTENQQKAKRRNTAAAIVAVAISVLLFITSLTQDAFFIDRADNPRAWSPGYVLLLIGWITVFEGVPAWLANPALAIAWFGLLARFRRTAMVSAALALFFAGSFLFCGEILTNEAGGYSRITSYGPGYWLWIGSAAVACLGSVVNLVMGRR